MATKQSDIGIGQASMMAYRYQVVDFLPYMFSYEFLIMTGKPIQTPAYETLIHPFDRYIWIFIFAFILFVSCALTAIEKVWLLGPGRDSQKNSTTLCNYMPNKPVAEAV